MSKPRADLGFSGAFEQTTPDDWAPKPSAPLPTETSGRVLRQAAESAGFVSRPLADQGSLRSRPRRVYRTGRSEQLNIKVRAEDVVKFYQICDGQGWVQGLTFQHALEALQRELKAAGVMKQAVSL